MLTMAGLFIAEDAGTVRMFREKAEAGVRVRLLISDPGSPAVALREKEEDTGPGVIAARVRNVLALLRPLRHVEGIEFRLHDAGLYTSIFRSDDDLIVNAHVYGMAGSNAPVLHPRKVPGGDMVTPLAGQLREDLARRPAARVERMTGRRIDYFDDPNAPRPTRIVPGVSVAVVNDAGR
jgi:hypothetical protein